MHHWYSLTLGDGMTAAPFIAEIEEAFLKKFLAAGQPANMAVFTRHESGRLHCEVVAYFSPAAADVANAFAAMPCEKPVRAELGLLAGDQSAWVILFPEDNA